MDSVVKRVEAKIKVAKTQLKDHIDSYPLNEYAHDLLKIKDSSSGSAPKNPIDFIIQTTMEKLQAKLLIKIRQEMKQITHSGSTELNVDQTESANSRNENNNSKSGERTQTLKDKSKAKTDFKRK